MIKIVFLDFDDTLFSHTTDTIPESAIKAINTAHEKGIKVFLCTGRALGEFSIFDLSNLHIDGMVCCNGQMVYEKDRLIYSNPLNDIAKDFVVDNFVNNKIPIMVIEEKDVYINFINENVERLQASISSPLPVVKKYSGNDIYMCSFFFDDEKDIVKLKPIENDVGYAFWRKGGIDIFSKNSSKALGIKATLDYYDLNTDECMGVGDGLNDIEMLDYCGVGVAMGNGEEELKKHADYITEHIDDDGLYNAFKHFDLI